MKIGSLARRVSTLGLPGLSYWIVATLIAGVLAARAVVAFDSLAEPPLAPLPVPLPPKPTEVFRDEFYGTGLAPHWSIERPDPAAFAVNDGALRVESRARVGISDDGLANVFRLNEPIPAGDWRVTAELKFQLDTGAENFYLTLWDDEEGWFGAQIRSVPNKYTGHRLMLAAVEGRDGRIRSRERPLVAIECNVCDSEWSWPGFSRKLIDDQVVRLRIDKRAGRYVVSGRLGENPGAEWVEIEPIGSPITTHSLAFGLAQSRLPDIRQGAVPGGASSAVIDWIAIEIPRESAVISDERPAVAQSVPTR
jgi:hypothetical protein